MGSGRKTVDNNQIDAPDRFFLVQATLWVAVSESLIAAIGVVSADDNAVASKLKVGEISALRKLALRFRILTSL